MLSPTPWTFVHISVVPERKESFGNIVSANGRIVAEFVWKKDAEAIIQAINSPDAAHESSSPKEKP